MDSFSEKSVAPGGFWPAFGVMFSNPVETLDSLREKPRWLLPLAIAALYSVAVNLFVVHRVGFLRLMNAVVRANSALDPQAALETALARKSQILGLQGLATVLGTLLTAFLVAKVLWLILTVLGRDVQFRRILAVVAYVTMLAAVAKESMLGLTAAMMRNIENFDLQNPVATNLAFFLRPGSPVASRLLASLDLITFANIFLLALGLTRMSRGLSLRAACILVSAPWCLYTAATLFWK